MNKVYTVETKPKVKINGILFQRNYDEMVSDNVKSALERMDKFFRSWSRRQLSTLGKILIVKTFGLSQLIYLLQSVELQPCHYKLINNLVYKFIWNRHYLAAKAPERIKRVIMCTPIKLGGYGMLDIMELDESLKIKAIGRSLRTSHPFIKMLAEQTNLDCLFYPTCALKIDPVHRKGVTLLKESRANLWENKLVERNRLLIDAVKQVKLTSILSREGKLSLNYFSLRIRGKVRVGDLTQGEAISLNRFLDRKIKELLMRAVQSPRLPPSGIKLGECILTTNGKFKEIWRCTSKEIRESKNVKNPICSFKLGNNLTTAEALTWGNKLSKLTSTKHKNVLLRFAHGEFYTKLKLHRYNLADGSECPRCGQIEDLKHKFIECEYIARIWRCANTMRNSLTTVDYNNIDPCTAIMGSNVESNITILTLNAEILLRISYLNENQNYLIHPRTFVANCVKTLARNERKTEIKETLIGLLT